MSLTSSGATIETCPSSRGSASAQALDEKDRGRHLVGTDPDNVAVLGMQGIERRRVVAFPRMVRLPSVRQLRGQGTGVFGERVEEDEVTDPEEEVGPEEWEPVGLQEGDGLG